MANTTNLNLTKLAGTEKLKTFPSPYNENMDAIDSAFGAAFGMNGAPDVDVSINNLADGLAIIANGNTHAAVTSGQFVYVRNHGSLSEGLYTATANIAANGTLSGSNLTANAKGGLNALSGDIADVSNDILQNVNISRMSISSVKTFTLNVPNNTQHLLLVSTNNNAMFYCGFVFTTSDGTLTTINIHKGSAVTINTSTNNRLVYTISDSNNRNFNIKDISMGTTATGRITLVTS